MSEAPQIHDVERAMAEYDAMAPEDQAKVKAMTKAGRDRVAAVRSVVEQNRAYNMERPGGPDHEVLDDPTTGEKAASYAEGLSSSLGAHAAPLARGASNAFYFGGAEGNFPQDPLTAFKDAFEKQSGAEDEAAEQAPGAYGAGGLTGDLANAAMGAAGPLDSAASAIEDVAVGGSVRNALRPLAEGPIASGKAALSNLGGQLKSFGQTAAQRAPAVAKAAMPDRAMKILQAALGEAGEAASPFPAVAWEPATTSVSSNAPAMAQPQSMAPMAPAAPPDRLAMLGEQFGAGQQPRALIPDEVMPAPRASPQPAQTAIKGLLPAPAPPAAAPAAQPSPQDMLEMLKRQFASMPLAPPANAPMGAAQIKSAVQQGVNAGVPLKDLAAKLGVNQGDIAAYYKAAQLGFLR